MPIDWQAAAQRAQELADEGYTPAQVNSVLDNEMQARAQKHGYANAADMMKGQARMAKATADLHAESVQPGPVTDDPIDSAFKAGHAAGGPGTQGGVESFIDTLFKAAQQGDARVTSAGTPSGATNEKWLGQAHARAIKAKDAGTRRRNV